MNENTTAEPKSAQAEFSGQSVPTASSKHAIKRRPFAGWLYAILFVVFDAIAVAALEVGVSVPSAKNDFSSIKQGFDIVVKMFTEHNFVFVLNLILVGLLYAFILMLTNRFWLTTAIALAIAITIAVLEYFKVAIRYEALLPADLGFLGSNTGNTLSFLPSGGWIPIVIAVAVYALLLVLIVALARRDERKGRMLRFSHLGLNLTVRLLAVVLALGGFALYCVQVSSSSSLTHKLSQVLGDKPAMWDSVYDARRNGPLVAFTRQVNPVVMDKPANYSEETMKQIAERYSSAAQDINKSRSKNITDQTVVYVLSESFSDPSRVPGLSLNKDSMPNIRSIKGSTTSGLMLSSGYGGGTANLEYMGLTGLSMANFNSSLTSPYQQLVPNEHWTPTINQLWGDASNSLAYHPYDANMYSRGSNYQKFGFSHLYTLAGDDVISHQDKIDDSPYVSDEAAYKSALEGITSGTGSKFVQLITMQNHMPYRNWYANNDFTATSTDSDKPLSKSEQESIETYQQGVAYTDQATQEFLDELDKLDKPVTVVFYGDHLPGIYSTASEDESNSLALHLTDYFIWSNKASGNQGTKIDNAEYSSPNFFSAQTAQYMNAKVSPYLAFLTKMHEKVAAMEPPLAGSMSGGEELAKGENTYLDAKGNTLNAADLDADAKQLLEDYQLIQYDITCGKNYLKALSFMDLPTK